MKAARLPYRTRMFAGILLIALLPLLITGMFAYFTYLDEVAEKMDATTQSIANQTRDRVAGIITAVKEYYVEVPKNADVEWLVQEEDIPYTRYTDVNAAIRHFRGSMGIYPYINGYAYIHRTSDFVITTSGMQRYSDIANREAVEALILPQAQAYYRMRWHNNMALYDTTATPRGLIDLRGYLLIMQLPINGEGTDQALIINLDRVSLYRLMMRDLDKYSVVVLDENREVFLSSDDALATYCAERYDDMRRLDAPVLATATDGAQYRLATAQSDSHNLLFIVGYNQALIQEGADRILTLILVLSLTVFGLVILSWVASLWLYRPVSKLASFFGGKEGPKGNELERITHGVEQLVGTNSTMERVIDDQRVLLTQTFVARLFRGELTDAQIDEQARQLRLAPAARYCTLACRLLADGGTDPASVDEDALRILFLDNLPAPLLALLYAPPVNDRNAIVLLLGAQDDDRLNAMVDTAYGMLTTYAEEEPAVGLYVGVSAYVDNLAWCRTAFLESVEALKSDVLTGAQAGGGINYYADLRPQAAKAGASYDALEQEIRLAIDTCNRGKATRCLAEFVGQLPGWVTARHENALRINRFLTIILSVLHEAGLSLDEVFAASEQTLYRQAGALYNTEALQRFILHSVIEPSIRALEAFREGATPMHRIQALVLETGGNLTLSECSDQLGYHTSYIWRILKTHTGLSFAEYVAQEKVAVATRMLEETDLPIAEIAAALRYTNAQNFIRFFSKHTGVTPGKYRQGCRKQAKGAPDEDEP